MPRVCQDAQQRAVKRWTRGHIWDSQRGRSGIGWRRWRRWRRPTPGASTSSRVSWRRRLVAQLADVHAEQADAGRRIDLVEQLAGRAQRRRARCRSADGSVTERVIVRKSWKRTLIVTVRPATPADRRRWADRVGQAHELASAACRGVWWSWAKVSSWPIDFARWSGSTVAVVDAHAPADAGARPLAAPSARLSVASARLGQVADRAMPRRCSFSSVFGPTPHSACTGSGWRNASSSPGSTTITPARARAPAARARLRRLRRELGEELRGGHADRARELLLVEHRGADLGGDRLGRRRGAAARR